MPTKTRLLARHVARELDMNEIVKIGGGKLGTRLTLTSELRMSTDPASCPDTAYFPDRHTAPDENDD